jgi:beta-lactamase class D
LGIISEIFPLEQVEFFEKLVANKLDPFKEAYKSNYES